MKMRTKTYPQVHGSSELSAHQFPPSQHNDCDAGAGLQAEDEHGESEVSGIDKEPVKEVIVLVRSLQRISDYRELIQIEQNERLFIFEGNCEE